MTASAIPSWIAACALLLCGAVPAPLAAQAFPAKSVRVIVPFAPGGGTDNLTRIIAPKLTETLGQAVVVDNRAGGNSQSGTELAARAAPDGHTLLHVDTSFTSNPSLFAKLPYDPLRDFAPVSLLASAPVVLIVHPSVPARTLKDLIALAKARPGELNFATGGAGSATHLGTELFKLAAGIDLVHIPYKGTGPATVAVLSGQVAIMIGGPSGAKPHVVAGRLRPLAVTGPARISALPDVPTFNELGLPGVDAGSYWVSLAPAGTPQTAVRILSAAMARAVQAPDVRPRLVDLGFAPIGSSPDECAANIRSEIEKWAKVVKAAGIRVE